MTTMDDTALATNGSAPRGPMDDPAPADPTPGDPTLDDPTLDDTVLAGAAEGWLEFGLSTAPTDRAAAEAGVRAAYRSAGLDRTGTVRLVRLTAGRCPRRGRPRLRPATSGRCVRGQVRTRPWAAERSALTARLGAAGWSRHWAASGARTWQLITDRLVTPLRTRIEAELPEDQPHGRVGPARRGPRSTRRRLAGRLRPAPGFRQR